MLCESKGEAEGALARLRSAMSHKFCPLTKTNCCPHCMSYYEGRVFGPNLDKRFSVVEPSCSSPVVTGIIHMGES